MEKINFFKIVGLLVVGLFTLILLSTSVLAAWIDQGSYLEPDTTYDEYVYIQSGSTDNPQLKIQLDSQYEILFDGSSGANIGSPNSNMFLLAGSSKYIGFGSDGTNTQMILKEGNVGIGTTSPSGKLDVDGSFYVGNQGIYDRDDSVVNIKEDLIVEGGDITGANSENIAIGSTNNVISFTSGGSERMRIHSNGNVGIGEASPSSKLDVDGDIEIGLNDEFIIGEDGVESSWKIYRSGARLYFAQYRSGWNDIDYFQGT